MYVIAERPISKKERGADPGARLALLNRQVAAVETELQTARAGVAKAQAAVEALGVPQENEQELRTALAKLHEDRALGLAVPDAEFSALHAKLAAATDHSTKVAPEAEGWRRAGRKHTIRAADAEERLSELRTERRAALLDVLRARVEESSNEVDAGLRALALGPIAAMHALAEAIAEIARAEGFSPGEIIGRTIDPHVGEAVRLAGLPSTAERPNTYADFDIAEAVAARVPAALAELREILSK